VDEHGHWRGALVDGAAARPKRVERAMEPRRKFVVRHLEVDDGTSGARQRHGVTPTRLRVQRAKRREQGVVQGIEILVQRVRADGHHADRRVIPNAADDRAGWPRSRSVRWRLAW